MTNLPSLEAQYGALCRELDARVIDYDRLTHAAAEAEVDYKTERAKAVLREKVYEGPEGKTHSRSVAEAELRAQADDRIRGLHLTYLGSAAAAEACKQAIYSLRARISFGQSLIASSREQDRQHAMAGGGYA